MKHSIWNIASRLIYCTLLFTPPSCQGMMHDLTTNKLIELINKNETNVLEKIMPLHSGSNIYEQRALELQDIINSRNNHGLLPISFAINNIFSRGEPVHFDILKRLILYGAKTNFFLDDEQELSIPFMIAQGTSTNKDMLPTIKKILSCLFINHPIPKIPHDFYILDNDNNSFLHKYVGQSGLHAFEAIKYFCHNEPFFLYAHNKYLIDQKNNDGKSALMMAIEKNQYASALEYIKLGAKLDNAEIAELNDTPHQPIVNIYRIKESIMTIIQDTHRKGTIQTAIPFILEQIKEIPKITQTLNLDYLVDQVSPSEIMNALDAQNKYSPLFYLLKPKFLPSGEKYNDSDIGSIKKNRLFCDAGGYVFIDLASIKELIKHGADCNQPLSSSWDLFLEMILKQIHLSPSEKIKKVLEELKKEIPTLNLNICNGYDQNLMHIFSKQPEYDRPEIFKALSSLKVDINAQDIFGNTPLHYILLRPKSPRKEEQAQTLISLGADINKKNNLQITPKDLLLQKYESSIILLKDLHPANQFETACANQSIFEEKTLDRLFPISFFGSTPKNQDSVAPWINSPGINNETPIFYVIKYASDENKTIEVLKRLKMYTADFNQRDANGLNILHISIMKGLPNVAQYLIEQHINTNVGLNNWGAEHLTLLAQSFYPEKSYAKLIEIQNKNGDMNNLLTLLNRSYKEINQLLYFLETGDFNSFLVTILHNIQNPTKIAQELKSALLYAINMNNFFYIFILFQTLKHYNLLDEKYIYELYNHCIIYGNKYTAFFIFNNITLPQRSTITGIEALTRAIDQALDLHIQSLITLALKYNRTSIAQQLFKQANIQGLDYLRLFRATNEKGIFELATEQKASFITKSFLQLYEIDINGNQLYLNKEKTHSYLFYMLNNTPYFTAEDIQIMFDKIKKHFEHNPNNFLDFLEKNHAGLNHFHLAILKQDIALVQKMLEIANMTNQQAFLNFLNNEIAESEAFAGYTPLHLAIYVNNPDIVSLLLQSGAIIYGTDEIESQLHLAIKLGKNDLLNILLDSQEDLQRIFTLENTQGLMPLAYTMQCNNRRAFNSLQEKGATQLISTITQDHPYQIIEFINTIEKNKAFFARRLTSQEQRAQIIETIVNIESLNENSISIIEFLLKCTDLTEQQIFESLLTLNTQKKYSLMPYFINHPNYAPSLQDNNNKTILHHIFANKDQNLKESIIGKILARTPPEIITIKDKYNNTPISLLFSNKNRRLMIIKQLHKNPKFQPILRSKIDFQKGNIQYAKSTFLHAAIIFSSKNIGLFLIASYPELIHQVNNEGKTPLTILEEELEQLPNNTKLTALKNAINAKINEEQHEGE
ncbi:MAG: hypothetical protein US69_C0001G0004 [candidate division TM6 bacterium GW2011_GWF2_38_10]|nr:MAG: hypothetical protein US69_C0001G0004 [candidate division TM6 bacterium GW2011_GWF2_38_10]